MRWEASYSDADGIVRMEEGQPALIWKLPVVDCSKKKMAQLEFKGLTGNVGAACSRTAAVYANDPLLAAAATVVNPLTSY